MVWVLLVRSCYFRFFFMNGVMIVAKIFFIILLLLHVFHVSAQSATAPFLERLWQQLNRLPLKQNQPDLFFSLFAAEMAIAQADYAAGAQFYLDAALQGNQAAIAQKAFALSLRIKNPETMYRAALRWQVLAPDDVAVTWHKVAALLWQEKVEAALAVVETENLLAVEPSTWLGPVLQDHYAQGLSFAIIKTFLDQIVAKEEWPTTVAIIYVRLALAEKNAELAKTILAQAAEKFPENGDIVILQATLALEFGEVSTAVTLLEQAHVRLPENLALKQHLFSVLIDNQEYTKAYAFLPTLLAHPAFRTDPGLYYTAGLLAVRLEDYAAAMQFFQKVLDLDPEGKAQNLEDLYYLLGQIAERQKVWAEAARWYAKVVNDRALDARLRQAVVVFKQQDLPAALALLQDLRKSYDDAESLKQIYLYQADILRDAEKFSEALATYEQALLEVPNDADLLYAQALLAEKLDDLSLFEKNLRQILLQDPENANAYNALGYTFADRNIRLDEAKELLEKAIALEPESAAITDSLGWLYFRLGDLAQAKFYIERAHQMLPDPEIIAHLGEIYLLEGKVAEAEALFRQGVQKFPDSPYLLKTLERLCPDLLPVPAPLPEALPAE
jgi:tetratricopeptide (TPR) repeat protein